MSGESQSLIGEYVAVLRAYLDGHGETALQKAYEVGHKALAQGMGVVQMATIHHQALAEVLAGMREAKVVVRNMDAFESCFLESLAPFEMTHRGFREANAALEASEERYRELFENANDIVFTTDLEGNFTSINKAGEQLSGYSRDESQSMNLRQVVAPEYQELSSQMFDRKVGGEPATIYELSIVTKQGMRLPLEVCTRLIYENGVPVGVHGIARDISERKLAQKALFRLNSIMEEEIKRIAHELHDEAGQLLASVHIALDETARETQPAGRERINKVKKLLDQIEGELRRLSHELRPTILDDLGLIPALEFLAQGVSKRSGIHVNVEGDTQGRLPPSIEIALYRLVQEALNNASRHAAAKRVDVRVVRQDGTLRCSIMDNGIGFDIRKLMTNKGKRGLGLIGMRERLQGVGGTCIITAKPGKGTQIIASVPLELTSASSNSVG